jgi:hypothetical protein
MNSLGISLTSNQDQCKALKMPDCDSISYLDCVYFGGMARSGPMPRNVGMSGQGDTEILITFQGYRFARVVCP